MHLRHRKLEQTGFWDITIGMSAEHCGASRETIAKIAALTGIALAGIVTLNETLLRSRKAAGGQSLISMAVVSFLEGALPVILDYEINKLRKDYNASRIKARVDTTLAMTSDPNMRIAAFIALLICVRGPVLMQIETT